MWVSWSRQTLWNGNEREQNQNNENIKTNTPPLRVIIVETQMKSVEYFNYMSNLVGYARFTREIKLRFVMAKTEFNYKSSFVQKIGLWFQEETSEMSHFGAFLFIVPKLGHVGKLIILGSFENRSWRKMLKIVWTHCVKKLKCIT